MDSNWHYLNRQLRLVESSDPFLDLDDVSIFQYLLSDLTQNERPPLFIVSDTIHLLQFYKKIRIKRINGFEENFFHRYRNIFIFKLLHQDAGIHNLHEIILTKGRPERRFFIPFIVRQISKQLMAIFSFNLSGLEEASADSALIHNQLVDQTDQFLDRFFHCGPLFSPGQIELFSFIRKEEDIPVIRSYAKALKFLCPAEPAAAKQILANTYSVVQFKDRISTSMGGICGIRSGGTPDNFSNILPSEFAMMEKNSTPDLFDIHLLENRLLSYTRDQSFHPLQIPNMNLVFLTPKALEYQPQIIPFGFLYLFMAIIFDIFRYCHIHYHSSRLSFYFVSQTDPLKGQAAFRLIDLVKKRDFPGVRFDLKTIDTGELNSLMRNQPKGRADSYICFSHAGGKVGSKRINHSNALYIEYGGQDKTDTIKIFHPGTSDKAATSYIMDTFASISAKMNAVRDLLIQWVLFNQNGDGYGHDRT